jgi:hypothetical protein
MTEVTHISDSADVALTPEETARQLGCTTGTLSKWRSTGRHNIPFLKYGSGQRAAIRYRQSAITAFLEASEIGGAA